MRGYFTKHEEADIDINMDDIIENLDVFSKQDLQALLTEVSDLLDVNLEERGPDSPFSISPDNLYDEQKMEYIKKLYENLTLHQLKELANQFNLL